MGRVVGIAATREGDGGGKEEAFPSSDAVRGIATEGRGEEQPLTSGQSQRGAKAIAEQEVNVRVGEVQPEVKQSSSRVNGVPLRANVRVPAAPAGGKAAGTWSKCTSIYAASHSECQLSGH